MNLNRQAFDTENQEQRLSTFLAGTSTNMSLLAGALAVVLLGLYLLSQAGLFGTAVWQLPAGAAGCALAALAQYLILRLARRGDGYRAYALFGIALGIWAILLTLLWESVWPAAVLLAWVAPLAGLAAETPRERVIGSSILSAAVTTGAVWLNARPPIDRLQANNAITMPSVVLLASAIVLFVLGTIVIRIIGYRSLQTRLVSSFVLIITVPVLVITGVSAVSAYTNSREQFGASLKAISSIQQAQIDSVVREMSVQVSGLQQTSGKASSILRVLDRSNETDEAYRLNVSVASTVLRDVMVQYPGSHYEEMLVLDPQGTVVLSTYKLDEGLNFADQPFFRAGSAGFLAEMTVFPGKQNTSGEYKLVTAAPLRAEGSAALMGIVVSVASKDAVYNILGQTAGLRNAQAYLVTEDNRPVSAEAGSTAAVSAWPIVHAILSKSSQEATLYINHQGRPVFGYARWDPSLSAALVTEFPSADLLSQALSTLIVSVLVGASTIFTALITAFSTSRAITEPISNLATAAGALSSGNLAARARTNQRDEVGELAGSFNSMADQLQGMIGNLEQRIAERTNALEQQSVRLRAAAEVARDAANAPDVDALLDDAARLIRDRFGLYHTGIFLLDDKREYAVLRASPSEAGKKMLENGHRLRVGEQGIVGRAASTGEPRIALDTGVDPVYFSNPLLPATRSEMALPLKTAEGTIGVIDIQSDQPEAFTQDDIAIVQVMADQLATAIQRSRLLQQVRAQLAQLELSYQNFTEESWHVFERTSRQNLGYRFDNVRLEPIRSNTGGLVDGAGGNGGSADGGVHGQTLQVPIRLRGQTIGTINLRLQSASSPEATLGMAQQISDRLATALENARLLEDSVRRANKERAIGEITSKISASVSMRNVLQTAVEELGRALPGSDVLVQIRPEAED
jgi:GAF domain-containing protein/HAMP domain-containing protein